MVAVMMAILYLMRQKSAVSIFDALNLEGSKAQGGKRGALRNANDSRKWTRTLDSRFMQPKLLLDGAMTYHMST